MLMFKKRLSKKADVEIQINWIFILIVGGIILIFFIGLITKQKTVSTTKLNINIRESLDTIFTSSQVASGTANLINTPELEVDFDCDNYYVGEFDSGINKPLGKTRIIFVPDRLEGKQLITWSLEWNMPYKIVDFLYIIPKEMRYVFIFNTDDEKSFAEEIASLMPKDVKPEVISVNEISNLEYTNNYKTRLVSFVNQPLSAQLNPSFEKKDLSYVSIVPDSNSKESGKVVFAVYSKNPANNAYDFSYARNTQDASTFPYIDYNPEFVTEKRYPTLLGAIITDSIDIYECMLKKALKRHSYITSIYNGRVDKIILATAEPDHPLKQRNCVAGMYQVTDPNLLSGRQELNPITSLSTSIEKCKNNLAYCDPYGDVQALVSVNKKAQDNSCPLVY
ncbi:hypothetical protein HYU06_05980 [Candidatus Woesearchaeota archaeon]|nr:hypothetical protein [Candidatus Woesearchaeota archaeon]